ncbi:MAG: hypothetical protein ACRDA8_17785 [Shewanella sp.]
MLIGLFILCALLVKTSLLGFGSIAIGIALSGYLCCRYLDRKLAPELRRKFRRLFISAAGLHLLAYAAIFLKLLLIDSLEDIASLVVSHWVMHHGMSAVIAAIVTFMAIGIYLEQQKLQGRALERLEQ